MPTLTEQQKDRVRSINAAFYSSETGVIRIQLELEKMMNMVNDDEDLDMTNPASTLVTKRNRIVNGLNALSTEIAAL